MLMPIIRIQTVNHYRSPRSIVGFLISRRSKVLISEIDDSTARETCSRLSGGRKYYVADHTEHQFSERYGNISVSATHQDKCGCVRFKKIGYTDNKWDTIDKQVSEKEEDMMMAQARMDADVTLDQVRAFIEHGKKGDTLSGPNAIPYDSTGAGLSFITPWRIWKASREKVWCTEECVNVYRAGRYINLAHSVGNKSEESHPAGYFVDQLLDNV